MYRILSGYIDVENVREYLERLKGCEAAIIDASYILDIENVKFAAEKALKAWNEGNRISKTLPMEILLHAAATRQIKDALRIGIKEGENTVFTVILNCERIPRFREDKFERVFPNKKQIEEIKEFYGISDEELEIVGTERLNLLIRERIALFSLR
jgi:KEOPS complex subunit Cgi121